MKKHLGAKVAMELVSQLRAGQLKRDLRASFRQRAELFQAHQSAYLTERLDVHLIEFLKTQEGVWAAFKGHGYEPRLDKAIKACPHIRWVYPKVVHEDHMEFVEAQKFVSGKFGIEEPADGKVIPVSEIKGFLVPGMAFDRQGYRLGRGKGYYDKALAQASGTKIGVCFEFQIYVEELPHTSLDQKMDLLVSEQGLVPCWV